MDNPHQDEHGQWWGLTEQGGWRPLPSAAVVTHGTPLPPTAGWSGPVATVAPIAPVTLAAAPWQPPRPPRRRVRPFSWVILAVNLLFCAWLVAGLVGVATSERDCGTLSAQACDAATGIGATIGAGLIIALWAVVDVVLLVAWLLTRRRR